MSDAHADTFSVPHTAELLRLLDALPVGIFYVDAELRYRFANRTYLGWFALEATQVIGRRVADVIGAAAFARVAPFVQRALNGESVEYEVQQPYQLGGTRDIHARLLPDLDAHGRVMGGFALIIDQSAQKEAQRQLAQNEERWKLALEVTGDGVWDWFPQSGKELLSPRLREIYGYAEGEIADLSEELDQRTHPDDLEQMRHDRRAHFEGKTPLYRNEHRVQCKDGQWKWILTRGMVIERDANGQPLRIVGTHTDISARKHIETALKESEKRLRMALSATRQGLYDIDLKRGSVLLDAEYAHLLGLPPEERRESTRQWMARVHPDDLAKVNALWHEHLLGHHQEFRTELRLQHASGAWIWVLTVGSVIQRDAEGRPERILGTSLDISDKKKSEALIWQQANIDTLTHLPNRRMFHDRLEQEMRKCERHRGRLALLFIDLDHFKEVNDTLGHAVGDQLLIDATARLQACIRKSDTLARLGGDEFTMILPDQIGVHHVEMIAQELIETLSAPFLLGEQEVFVSASIGITFYPDDAREMSDLIKHADQAMYAAKARGRNCFSHFTPDLQTSAIERMRLIAELREALAQRALTLAFQPVVSLSDGRIVKAETLIRWPRPGREAVSPALFIPLAEASGLIVQVGEFVFQEALAELLAWHADGFTDLQLSINQSPIEFLRDPERYARWIRTLQDTGLPGAAFIIEITEGLLLENNTLIAEHLLRFRDAGIGVALDDFGTGYSSLSYLNRFDIDFLKIDQSFIRDLGSNPSNRVLCEAIIVMAHKLGLKVIAEGVESAEQRDILHAAGCDFAQGYFFSRPLSATEFHVLLLAQDRRRTHPAQ